MGKRGRQEFSIPDYVINMRVVQESAKNSGEAGEQCSTQTARQERGTHHVADSCTCDLRCKGTRHSDLKAPGAAVTGTSGKDSQPRHEDPRDLAAATPR